MENTQNPYNHSLSSLSAACGFTQQEVDSIQKRANKAIHPEEDFSGTSQYVENLEKTLNPRELAYVIIQLSMKLSGVPEDK